MDWIKMILDKHTKEDGTVDVEAANKEIDAEFPKNAVPKADFNSKAEELKTANETLTTLQKSNKDNEGLQSKIAEYETEVQRLKTEQSEITKSFALKEALTKEGALPDYIDLLLPTLKDVELDANGNFKGLEDALKGIKESKPALFKAEEQTPPPTPGGYKPIDTKLDPGKQSEPQPQNLADAIKQSYENKQQ